MFYPYPQCTETADRELLPSWHQLSVYPKREFPFVTALMLLGCIATIIISILYSQYPQQTVEILEALLISIGAAFDRFIDWAVALVPRTGWSLFATPSPINSPLVT